jgi:uncharacterized NAD(P)/FAD-binding protein YdhS
LTTLADLPPNLSGAGTTWHQCHVVIVGGGASGVALAIALLRHTSNPLSIDIVNREGLPGRGVAYGTTSEDHILNVAAARMSIVAEDPDHFLRWLSSRSECCPAPYVPRYLYGAYLEETLQHETTSHPAARVNWINGDAVHASRTTTGVEVRLDSDVMIHAGLLVLATGNLPPADPPVLRTMSSHRYIRNAWAPDTLERRCPSGDLLVLGSGLTAIDKVLSLARSDPQQRIFLLSRHGLIPASHADAGTWSSDWLDTVGPNVRQILHQLRLQISLAEKKGVNWRAVLDSMRPVSPRIWELLSYEERCRFLRHARAHWDAVRHRLPAHISRKVRHLIADGRICVIAGRITAVDEHADAIVVTYRERCSLNESRIPFAAMINCTGPGNAAHTTDRFLCSLLETGLAQLDELGIGFKAAPDGQLISAEGKPSGDIYTIGPVRKASAWETTAIAEIRAQALNLARCLAEKLPFQSRAISGAPKDS